MTFTRVSVQFDKVLMAGANKGKVITRRTAQPTRDLAEFFMEFLRLCPDGFDAKEKVLARVLPESIQLIEEKVQTA